MVAFHKELRVSPTITAKSMFRNKIPETLRPGCKFSLCSKCGLFPLGCSGDSAMETTNPASKPSVGELFRIFRDDNPLCSQRTRVSGRVGPKFPVCSVHFSDSGIDAGRWLESVTPQFV
jgi:hypothetical protein